MVNEVRAVIGFNRALWTLTLSATVLVCRVWKLGALDFGIHTLGAVDLLIIFTSLHDGIFLVFFVIGLHEGRLELWMLLRRVLTARLALSLFSLVRTVLLRVHLGVYGGIVLCCQVADILILGSLGCFGLVSLHNG